jgi:hypothetical protein
MVGSGKALKARSNAGFFYSTHTITHEVVQPIVSLERTLTMLKKIYGPAFQQVRADRLEFCKGECELAIHGRDVCKQYRIECHHKDNEAYERDRRGTITINDVVCVCSCCHHYLTTQTRRERYSGRAHTVPLVPENPLFKEYRNVLAKCHVSPVLERPASDEERANRRSAKQIRKGIQGN